MKRLIIVGSPRTSGRSAHLAEMLFEANIDEHPEDELFLVPVSEVEIGPCIGCDACRKKSGVILKGDDGQEVTQQKHRCVFDDDMQTLYDLIDDAEEVTVVSPVYFSGAPAPMKCVLDRLQPYFWAHMEAKENGDELPEKRPLTLHVIGEGGDPHGYGALVSEVRSAFSVANFRLDRILDWVGKIDETGEITAEAAEAAVPPLGGSGLGGETPSESAAAEQDAASEAGSDAPVAGAANQARQKPRPKLDLHSGIRDVQPADEKRQGTTQGKSQRSKQSRQQSRGPASSAKKKQGKRRGK